MSNDEIFKRLSFICLSIIQTDYGRAESQTESLRNIYFNVNPKHDDRYEFESLCMALDTQNYGWFKQELTRLMIKYEPKHGAE